MLPAFDYLANSYIYHSEILDSCFRIFFLLLCLILTFVLFLLLLLFCFLGFLLSLLHLLRFFLFLILSRSHLSIGRLFFFLLLFLLFFFLDLLRFFFLFLLIFNVFCFHWLCLLFFLHIYWLDDSGGLLGFRLTDLDLLFNLSACIGFELLDQPI